MRERHFTGAGATPSGTRPVASVHRLATRASRSVPAPLSHKILVLAFIAVELMAIALNIVLTPPMQTPDAFVQFDRYSAMSSGDFVADVRHGQPGNVLPAGLLKFEDPLNYIPFHYAAKIGGHLLAREADVSWGRRSVFVPFGQATQYGPVAYLPGAAAVAVARWFSPNVLVAYYALEVVNGLVFLALVATALALIRGVGAWLIFGLAILPMTVALAASPSTDGIVIGCCMLLVAIVARELANYHITPAGAVGTGDSWKVPPISRQEWVAILALLVILLAKPPYLPLVMALAAPDVLARRFRLMTMRTISRGAIVGVPTTIWYLVGARFESQTNPSVHAGLQAAHLLHHPGAIVTVVVNSWGARGLFYLKSFVGLLGWLDTPLADWVYIVIAACLVALGILFLVGSKWNTPLFGWIALAAGLGYLAVALTLYVDFSPVYSPTILGFQGRYLLPLAPLFILSAAPSAGTTFWHRVSWWLSGVSVWLMSLCAEAGMALALLFRYWVR